MKLSIILTVYNKEPYLRRSLDSLLAQEGTEDNDYEVLAVNDGSTDGSAEILKEYAAKDCRVRILTQQNQGLSMARNNGTEVANGDYVWYVDADDTFSSKSVRLLCNAMINMPEVIAIGSVYIHDNSPANAFCTDSTTGRDALLRGWGDCGVFYVIRRSFLAEQGLRFYPGIYHEDDEFTPRLLYKTESLVVVPEVLYYIFREDTSSITQMPRAKRAFDCLTVGERLNDFVIKNGECGTDVGRIIDSHASTIINNAFSIIVQNSKEKQKRFNKAFRKKLQLLRPLRYAHHKKYHIEAILFRLFPYHTVQIYKMMKKL